MPSILMALDAEYRENGKLRREGTDAKYGEGVIIDILRGCVCFMVYVVMGGGDVYF